MTLVNFALAPAGCHVVSDGVGYHANLAGPAMAVDKLALLRDERVCIAARGALEPARAFQRWAAQKPGRRDFDALAEAAPAELAAVHAAYLARSGLGIARTMGGFLSEEQRRQLADATGLIVYIFGPSRALGRFAAAGFASDPAIGGGIGEFARQDCPCPAVGLNPQIGDPPADMPVPAGLIDAARLQRDTMRAMGIEAAGGDLVLVTLGHDTATREVVGNLEEC